MMEIDNDKLLRQFFQENKQEIPDNGFSGRVMQQLSGRKSRWANLWPALVVAIAAVLFIRMDGLQIIWSTLREVFTGMVQQGAAQLDPKSLLIAAIVLLFLGTKKVCSLA